MKKDVYLKELQKISKSNGGLLLPENVVEKAKDIKNPLHSYFEWDDKKASDEYRLYQARNLIRVSVQYLSENPQEPYKVFVSMKEDRYNGGGYRELVSVMDSPRLRESLINEAAEEMQVFIDKYKHLKELAYIISEMNKVIPKIRKIDVKVRNSK
jgi:hypothetical protein